MKKRLDQRWSFSKQVFFQVAHCTDISSVYAPMTSFRKEHQAGAEAYNQWPRDKYSSQLIQYPTECTVAESTRDAEQSRRCIGVHAFQYRRTIITSSSNMHDTMPSIHATPSRACCIRTEWVARACCPLPVVPAYQPAVVSLSTRSALGLAQTGRRCARPGVSACIRWSTAISTSVYSRRFCFLRKGSSKMSVFSPLLYS